MQYHDSGRAISVRISGRETSDWARRWPCSTLRGKRVRADFDTNGLLDLALDGGRGAQDCDAHELNALVSDFVARRMSREHPCYFVVVGQFRARV
jgi:hypothetical protein